ncbi:uncharacterized protein LOC121188129 [Toxotes jaculatrix]|uniref:uncharacterized protein LOC121188129 n=1 Tax=Toxotes jaculatrix TaxID=941984 RepID=UPI001B3A88FC|nr:uncharacterized protein LOC121188129 [Toxotes jaculatrix]
MLIILHLLLLLRAGRCTDDLIFETKVVGVGDDVNLTCARQKSGDDDPDPAARLYWIRLVSGNLPEFLGGTFSFDYKSVNTTPRITAKQEPGTFLLHISKTERRDTGFYYCIKVTILDMKFLRGTFLRIKGPEPDITDIIQVSPSDPVHPGDSVTLQCSVLSDSEMKTCPGDHSVFWFRAGSDESRPSFIYTHGNSGDQCGQSPEAHSPQKCVYSFSKNVSSSDAGTYYCAVATCGQILFGNGTKLNIEAHNVWDLQTASTLLILLCAALVISLIVIAILIYLIKKKTCDCCKAAVSLQTDSATASGNQKSHLRDEDSLVYSAPTFTSRKAGKAERRNTRTAEGETVYTDSPCTLKVTEVVPDTSALKSGCTDDLIFETKVVRVGDDVNLTCTLQDFDANTRLYWIRVVSGNLPEFLGGTYRFDYRSVNTTSRITATRKHGFFLLLISKTELSDNGVYYCMKIKQLDMKFLRGTFLRIKGPEPDITDIIQVSPSDPVHPGDSVTLQCSVLSDSETKTCAGDHSVFWFRAGSDESHPSFIYTHGNSGDQCGQSPEAHSPQKCVYSFSKNVSSSDAGTYYCAVATCGQILFGNGSKLNIEAHNTWDLQTPLILLCAALVISLIVIAILIYLIKKKTCDCCKAAVSLQTDSAAASGNQKSHLRDEDSLIYSAPTFTSRKAGKAERRNTRTAEGETVYTDVRALP